VFNGNRQFTETLSESFTYRKHIHQMATSSSFIRNIGINSTTTANRNWK